MIGRIFINAIQEFFRRTGDKHHNNQKNDATSVLFDKNTVVLTPAIHPCMTEPQQRPELPAHSAAAPSSATSPARRSPASKNAVVSASVFFS